MFFTEKMSQNFKICEKWNVLPNQYVPWLGNIKFGWYKWKTLLHLSLHSIYAFVDATCHNQWLRWTKIVYIWWKNVQKLKKLTKNRDCVKYTDFGCNFYSLCTVSVEMRFYSTQSTISAKLIFTKPVICLVSGKQRICFKFLIIVYLQILVSVNSDLDFTS